MKDKSKCIAISLPTSTWSHCFVGSEGNSGSVYWNKQTKKGNIYVWSCRKKHIGCILNLFQKPQSMICLQIGWSFQDGRQSASKPVHHNNELLDPVLFLRSVASINPNNGLWGNSKCITISLSTSIGKHCFVGIEGNSGSVYWLASVLFHNLNFLRGNISKFVRRLNRKLKKSKPVSS